MKKERNYNSLKELPRPNYLIPFPKIWHFVFDVSRFFSGGSGIHPCKIHALKLKKEFFVKNIKNK